MGVLAGPAIVAGTGAAAAANAAGLGGAAVGAATGAGASSMIGAAGIGGTSASMAANAISALGGATLNLSGSGGGAFVALGLGCTFIGVIWCFSPDTTVQEKTRGTVLVTELKEGDFVLDGHKGKKQWARVTNVTIVDGAFPAVRFKLESDEEVCVTLPHFMLVKRSKRGSAVVLKAADVAVGMRFRTRDGGYQKIVAREEVTLKKKVNVETATGSMYANDILTTGVCEKGKTGETSPPPAAEFLTEYKERHGFADEDVEQEEAPGCFSCCW